MQNAWREINLFLARFLSPAVRWIFLVNVIVFILFMLLIPFSRTAVGAFAAKAFFLLAQTPALALGHLFVWQFVTYMFLHAGPGHILCNMLVLWFFAPRLEYRWGTPGFLRFYFIVGIGSGFFHTAASYLTGYPDAAMVGASGALYGIMLAYALYWPNDVVLLYFVLPIRIKYLMIIFGVITFLASISSVTAGPGDGNISHVTHLGGLLIAALYLYGGRWFGGGGPRRRRIYRAPGGHPDFR